MKNQLKSVIFTFLSLSALASVDGQSIRGVAFNIGGGPVFHTGLNPDYQYSANYWGGNIQLYFINKGNFSFGLQAGVQRVIEKFQLTEFGWHIQYPQYLDQSGLRTNQPDMWISKYHLWQFLFNLNYQFRNNIILEGSIGTNLFVKDVDNRFNLNSIPLIGFGGGYLFRITNSLYIPLKLKAYYEYTSNIENDGVKINGRSLYPGIYSGILFNLN